MKRGAAVLAALVAAVLLGSTNGGAAPTQSTKLFGSVGPDFEISLLNASGTRVTQLEPGTYDIQVRDRSDFHTFHLQGPGVDERTDDVFTGTVNWTVTFRDGNYVFFCDVHPTLRGAFVAGTPASPPPPPSPSPSPPPPPPSAITPKTKLVVTAGPRQVITLRTAAGKPVKQLQRGTYTVTIRDRSRIHNVHLSAPGYDRKTTLLYTGTQVWKVRLARVGAFRYRCDPHSLAGMRGSAKIVA